MQDDIPRFHFLCYRMCFQSYGYSEGYTKRILLSFCCLTLASLLFDLSCLLCIQSRLLELFVCFNLPMSPLLLKHVPTLLVVKYNRESKYLRETVPIRDKGGKYDVFHLHSNRSGEQWKRNRYHTNTGLVLDLRFECW